MASPPTREITVQELRRHDQPGDLWVAVSGLVYNVSSFANVHPGGAKVLEELGGHDVTEEFYELHRAEVLTRPGRERLIVGRLAGSGPQVATGPISAVPFSEIAALQWQKSPFYTESHKRFQAEVRAFVDAELAPIAAAADLSGAYPDRELIRKLGAFGLQVCRLGPGPWMDDVEAMGLRLPGGVKPSEFDYFHEMICHMEVNRLGRPGFIDSLGAGMMISAPAIYNFGTEAMKRDVGRKVILGEVNSALAISEPFAGSDVARIRTTAVKTVDGRHYIVNGVKKWITEGCYSDFFVTAVRTGDDGAGGITMLLIERTDDVETTQIKTTYSTCPGTALVVFDNVKVPVENVLGKVNDGFKLIMYNFNHERWMIVQAVIAQARGAITDSFLWAKQRKIFGKTLIDQPVIRNKLAGAVAALESVQAYNEALTYDMCVAKDGPLGRRLAGPIAMLKYQSTRMGWLVADETVQILGGRGITKTGMGARVEGFKNFVKYAAVYGGSEEIMADLAVKQALRNFPVDAKL
eukprot:m.416177 g.416177  ORF g.416177 m.416177 type:complete len:522 (-) comp29864_c0_seq1:200-1765(-)